MKHFISTNFCGREVGPNFTKFFTLLREFSPLDDELNVNFDLNKFVIRDIIPRIFVFFCYQYNICNVCFSYLSGGNTKRTAFTYASGIPVEVPGLPKLLGGHQ